MTALLALKTALDWVVAHKGAATALVLALVLALCRLQLALARADAAAARGQLADAKASISMLEASLDQQNAAVDNWRLQAQAAQADARRLRAAAETGFQAELARARALLERPKDPTTCPEAWDRLFQALEGVQYQGVTP